MNVDNMKTQVKKGKSQKFVFFGWDGGTPQKGEIGCIGRKEVPHS